MTKTRTSTKTAKTKMTTEDSTPTVDRSDRLAELAKRRQSADDHKRAVIGKIVATGLTSTTVFGITAALGWSAQNTEDATPVSNTEQLVLDLATGQLVTMQNGVPVSVQQVMPAATAAPVAPIAGAPVDSLSSLAAPVAPSASKGSATASADGSTTGTAPSPLAVAPVTMSPEAATAPVTTPSEVVVATPAPAPAPIQQVEIPVAIPAAPVAIAVPSQGSSSGS